MRSEIKTYLYECDGRGCPAHHITKGTNSIEADDKVAQAGWKHNGWNWFCPFHTITGTRVDVPS